MVISNDDMINIWTQGEYELHGLFPELTKILTALLTDKTSIQSPHSFDDSWLYRTAVTCLLELSLSTPHRAVATTVDRSFDGLQVWFKVHPARYVASVWSGLVPATKIVSEVFEKGGVKDESGYTFAERGMLGDLLELVQALLAAEDEDPGQDVASTAGSKLLSCQARRFEILWSEVAADNLRELWWKLLHGKRRIIDGRT